MNQKVNQKNINTFIIMLYERESIEEYKWFELGLEILLYMIQQSEFQLAEKMTSTLQSKVGRIDVIDTDIFYEYDIIKQMELPLKLKIEIDLIYKHIKEKINPLTEDQSSEQMLCACCHKFVISVDEIQNFRLSTDQEKLFNFALTEIDFNKSIYLLNRFIKDLSNTDILKTFELWMQAENAGNLLNPYIIFDLEDYEIIFTDPIHRLIYNILKHRSEEHDDLIYRLQVLALKKNDVENALKVGVYYSTAKNNFFIC